MWTMALAVLGGCLTAQEEVQAPFVEPDCGQDAPVAALERWPYVQDVTPTGATIAWGTEPGVTDTVLRYGHEDRAEEASPTTRPLPIGATDEIALHHVVLTDLEPGRTYCYGVDVQGESRTWNLRFRTAPAEPDAAVTFLAIGDMGAGTPDQYAVREAMMAHLDEVDFLITLGDNAYSSGDWDEWHFNVFRVYQEMLTRVPMFPTLGNHDYKTDGGQPYLDNLFLPRVALREADQERYYSVDYGAVRFVALDSEDSILQAGTGDDQLTWLDAELETWADRPWVIPAYHQPTFTNHPDRAPNIFAVGLFAPRFEQHGVQVVLNGHNHHYERSVPLVSQAAHDDGVTYIISGGGGRGLYDLVLGEDPRQAHGEIAHHFLLGEADACTLRIQAIGVDGIPFDEVSFSRCE